MLMPPPAQSGPPLPEGQTPEDAVPAERASTSERVIVIVVLVLIAVLFGAVVIFPHSPLAAWL